MNRTPKPQEIYKHFKGNLYQVITIAEHSETGESMVIYQALYGTFKVYARPLASFTDKVDKVKYPQAEQEYRFELQQMQEDGGTKKCCNMESGQKIKRCEETTDSVHETMIANESVTALRENAVDNEEPALDPLVWEFLDADSHEARLNILAGLHHRITDDMITTMAVACDIEVPEGNLEERYSQLKNCLQMLDRFEIRRV